MNIAIITVYQPFTNLGSFLQAYALKIFLEKHGHKVSFIKTGSHVDDLKKIILRIRPYRSFFLRMKKAIKSLNDLQKLSYVKPTDKNIDCYIWGSDEIWNVTNEFFCQPIFWDVSETSKPKIGYAISAGHASLEDFREHSNLVDKITDFQLILSRDSHTQKLLKSYCGITSERVIDPTLLVHVKELSESITVPKQKYILVYTYGLDNNMIDIVKRFASKYNLIIVSPCFWHLWADRTIECSALQFSTLISNAEYVFTTTFHGAIFSLINHSKCAILPLRPKVKDLCITLRSEDRIVADQCNLEEFEKTIMQPFSVNEFESNLERLRDTSSTLLLAKLNQLADEK